MNPTIEREKRHCAHNYHPLPVVLKRGKGVFVWDEAGNKYIDMMSAYSAVSHGHANPRLVRLVQKQVATLDYCMGFQVTNNKALELAERATALAPEGISRCFFTNSGSESVDTALKIALGYHRARGEGNRTRLIGREKGYHGVNFGGMSVGGMVPNRKVFSAALLPGVDHLRHTLDIERNAFSRGLPAHGVELAEDLERLCQLHDGSNIAAVIVEPRPEFVPGARAIVVVAHVVFTCPLQLHRLADFAGNPGCLDHRVVAQPAAEAAAQTHPSIGNSA